MKRNQTRVVFQRHNIIKEGIYDFFFAIASRPRLLLEVFIKGKMGRRYFRISSAFTVFVILVLIPYIKYKFLPLTNYLGNPVPDSGFWGKYVTWYLFTALFVFFCTKRVKETYPQGNVYDYNYFSLSSGYSLPLFTKPPFLTKRPSDYQLEVFVEPAFFFVIGLILNGLGQPLGGLLIFCSICYGFSYAAAYSKADEKMQDLIDEIIHGEELDRSFVHGFEASRGVKNPQRPSDENLRSKMGSRMFTSSDDIEDAEFTVL